MYKITKEHFSYFKKRCEYWQEIFGLKNWELFFKQSDLGDNTMARLLPTLEGYVTTVFIAKKSDWPVTREALDYNALHEICHLLLHRFSKNAQWRYIQLTELEESEEEVVRTLCNVIRRKDR